MSNQPLTTTTKKAVILDGESAEDLVVAIGQLLDAGEFVAAQRTAARAAEAFGEHPWLRRAHKVLNPGVATVRPGRDHQRDRKKELDWLRHHSDAYRGKWVALLEGRLLAAAESFEELMDSIPGPELQARPLVHHVE